MKLARVAVSQAVFAVVMITYLLGLMLTPAAAQLPPTVDPPSYGAFNGVFIADGDGLKKPLGKDDSVLRADSPWSLYLWVRAEEPQHLPSLLAGVGEVAEQYPHYLGIDNGHVILWMGKENA